ncbi:hypothetical protein Cpir12675_003436 [Ceratocystis pirilliformis]|uniref:Zn(2)-C6 fungal-type domain-containing protein n=1 Tax=Ceratocystis pirilliformis TaxID=259994 RepID=A0ABR3Z3Y0_9PEZI
MDNREQQKHYHHQQHPPPSSQHNSFNDFPNPLPAIAISAPAPASVLVSTSTPTPSSEQSFSAIAATTGLSSSAPGPKKRRSQASLADCCKTCRLRKVKCTGKPADGVRCTICQRLDLKCSFVALTEGPIDIGSARSTPSRSHTEAGTIRKRAQRACTNCHMHKTKCSSDQPRCKRCEANNMVCEYQVSKRKFNSNDPTTAASVASAASAPSQTSEVSPIDDQPTRVVDDRVPDNAGVDGPAGPGSPEQSSEALHTRFVELLNLESEDLLRRRDFIQLHVDAYFQNVYHLPCLSFYHRESLYKEIEKGTLSPTQVAAICSVAAFFITSNENAKDFAMTCCRQVEFQLFRNVGSLTESNLTLYALCIVHNLFVGKYAKCWQLVAVACRIMLGLQLNWDIPGSQKSFIQQECSRRLAWHMFHMDRICAGGFDAYVCFNEDNMKLRLPCNEEAFQTNQPVSAERLTEKGPRNVSSSTYSMGRQGYTIRLINLRHHVQSIAKKFSGGTAFVHGVKWEASRVMEEVNRLQNEVSSFTASLPDDLKLNEQNIARWAGSREEQIYVFVHSWICALHVELYQFAVPGLQESGSAELLRKLPNTFLIKAQKQAVAFAVAAARFWHMFQAQATINRDPLAPLFLGDTYLMPSVQGCTKVLITALHHNLYDNLAEHSTAPLSRAEPINADSMRDFITATVTFIKPLASVIPSMKTQFTQLCKDVAELDKKLGPKLLLKQAAPDQPLVSPQDPPPATFNVPMKLPGPEFILDNASTFNVSIRADDLSTRPMADPNLMVTNWLGMSTPTPCGSNSGNANPNNNSNGNANGNANAMISSSNTTTAINDPHDMYTDMVGFGPDFDSEFCPPGMPLLLAEARGLPAYSVFPIQHSQHSTRTNRNRNRNCNCNSNINTIQINRGKTNNTTQPFLAKDTTAVYTTQGG